MATARWIWAFRLALVGAACAGAVSACSSGGGAADGGAGGADGDGPDGPSGSGTQGTGAGTGQGGSVGTGTGTPMFETDIVPIFEQSCGASKGTCHAANAYAADPNQNCRGWLSLKNEPLGSMKFENEQWVPNPGCNDVELYLRLLTIAAWEECDGVGKPYIKPCDLEGSYVWNKIDGGPYCGPPDLSDPMPPDEDLPPSQKETIKQWILAGAPRIDGTVDACANPTTSSSTASTGSGNPAQDPIPLITHPGDGEMRPVDVPVPLIGEASDPQDGDLPGQALSWSSSIDGALGSGAQFSVSLSEGTHTLTLQATDTDGNTASTSITVIMVP